MPRSKQPIKQCDDEPAAWLASAILELAVVDLAFLIEKGKLYYVNWQPRETDNAQWELEEFFKSDGCNELLCALGIELSGQELYELICKNQKVRQGIVKSRGEYARTQEKHYCPDCGQPVSEKGRRCCTDAALHRLGKKEHCVYL